MNQICVCPVLMKIAVTVIHIILCFHLLNQSTYIKHTVNMADLYYNKPTRRSCLQSILFHCRVTLHVSGAFHTHHQGYIKLFLQPVVQVILWLQLPSSNVAKLAMLEAGSCNHNMTCTGGCRYSLMYS